MIIDLLNGSQLDNIDDIYVIPTHETKGVVFFKEPTVTYNKISKRLRGLILGTYPIPLRELKGAPLQLDWWIHWDN